MSYDSEAHEKAVARLLALEAKLAESEAALPGLLLTDNLEKARRAEKAAEELRARVKLSRKAVARHEAAKAAAELAQRELAREAAIAGAITEELEERSAAAEELEEALAAIAPAWRRILAATDKVKRLVAATPDCPLLSAYDLGVGEALEKIRQAGGRDPTWINPTGLAARARAQGAGILAHLRRSPILKRPAEESKEEVA